MIPFRVFNRDTKEMWQVLSYQSGVGHGSYLVARESDDSSDGEMAIFSAEELSKFRFVDFMDDSDSFEG